MAPRRSTDERLATRAVAEVRLVGPSRPRNPAGLQDLEGTRTRCWEGSGRGRASERAGVIGTTVAALQAPSRSNRARSARCFASGIRWDSRLFPAATCLRPSAFRSTSSTTFGKNRVRYHLDRWHSSDFQLSPDRDSYPP